MPLQIVSARTGGGFRAWTHQRIVAVQDQHVHSSLTCMRWPLKHIFSDKEILSGHGYFISALPVERLCFEWRARCARLVLHCKCTGNTYTVCVGRPEDIGKAERRPCCVRQSIRLSASCGIELHLPYVCQNVDLLCNDESVIVSQQGCCHWLYPPLSQ